MFCDSVPHNTRSPVSSCAANAALRSDQRSAVPLQGRSFGQRKLLTASHSVRERCLPVNLRNRQARCLRPKRKWWPESESNQRHADFQSTVGKKTSRNSSTYSTKDWVRHGCDKRQYFVLTPTVWSKPTVARGRGVV